MSLALVRRAARLPGLRRLTQVDAVTRVTFALRGSLVRERTRFALNELRARPLATYHLRGSNVIVAIRHRTPDVMVLDEIFSQHEYDFPLELGAAPRVVDLGANIGLFGAWVLMRYPDASIVGVEADEANAAAHEAAIAANTADWRLIHAFAATAPGEVRFEGGAFSTSHAAETGDVVEAIDVFPLLADADLIKIDIEGAEWPLLTDKRFATLAARAVVLEYHGSGDPRATARELLRAAGFDVHDAGRKERCGAGLVWAVRSG